jgi:hypothetical protein
VLLRVLDGFVICKAGMKRYAEVRNAVAHLLSFTAEWAAIGAGVERFTTVPTESWLGGFAGFEACLDVLHVFEAVLG